MTPYPSDFGQFVLAALPYAGMEALRIAGLIAIPFAVILGVIFIARHRRALAALMDDGDGQGGVPPVARRLAQAEAPTEAISMRDIVVRPALEDTCPQFCDNLAEVGDPGDCGCKGACGRSWCPRRRSPVPVTWTEREEGVR